MRRAAALTVALCSTALLMACQGPSRLAGPVESPAVVQSAPSAEGRTTVGGSAQEGDPTMASITAIAARRPLMGRLPLNGQTLSAREYQALMVLIGCEWGCPSPDGETFNLPSATAPWGSSPQPAGPMIWQITVEGWFPMADRDGGSWPAPMFPGEVFFTAAGSPDLAAYLRESGFTELPLGDIVAPGVRAFRVPVGFEPPQVDERILGQLRLFAPGVALPEGIEPADGRQVSSTSRLGGTLSFMGYPIVNGSVALPMLAPVDGYRWGIDGLGEFPQSD